MFINLILLCCFIVNITFCFSNVCVWKFTNVSDEKYLPVPLFNDSSIYSLAELDNGTLFLPKNKRVVLICPGPKNYFTSSEIRNSNVTEVTCVGSNRVKIIRDIEDINNIFCKQSVKGDVQQTERRCGGSGFIYQIGYHITKQDWISLITICHEPYTGNTLYSQHKLNGKTLKYASKVAHTSFSTSGLDATITASVSYKQASQKAIFDSILGSATLADHYIYPKSYLARGHLSPHADFLLASSQYSTYYYINTTPKWQHINAGNWKSIENTVRKLSQRHGVLNVITGTHDILRYHDNHGTLKEIYLVYGNKLPVPKFIWKIAYRPSKQKGIVFVILNDPFTTSDENFCPDICQNSGFSGTSWKNTTRGYVWCCDYKQFRNIVHGIPKLTVRDVLRMH